MNYETSTAYWIERGYISKEIAMNLRSKFSVLDFMTKAEVPTAYFEIGDHICIPKIKFELLESLIKGKFYREIIIPNDNKEVKYSPLKYKEMNHQKDIVKGAVEHFKNEPDKRVCVCARPGFGKTFMSAAIVSKMKCKFMFIVYSSDLVEQTYDAFVDYFGTSEGFLRLDQSKGFMEIDYKKVNGIFLTHSMIQSLIKRYGMMNVTNVIFNKFKCDMKIMDEYDTYVKNLYFLECWGNFKYNLYLTGTKFKNMRPDDNIFQMIYKHAKTLGADVRLPVNRECYVIKYKFSPTKREYFLMHMNDEKLFKVRYNDYIARKDVLLDYVMKNYYKSDDSPLRTLIKDGGSIALYVGRIENCEIVKDKLINYYGIKEEDIGIYNSTINKKEKAISETKPWIVTTTKSMGRGYDNKNLRALIFLEFNFGTADYMQNISRVARIGGKSGLVFEGLDLSFPKVIANHSKKVREDIYTDMYSQVHYREIPEPIYKYYNYGYRPDSKFILEQKKKRR